MVLPALVACGEMSDLALDASELQGHYKTPMALELVGGSLIVSVPEVDISKLHPTAAREYALDIAKFAYAHYRHRQGIEQVEVQFVSRAPHHGRVTYAVAGSWPISSLSDTSSATPILP
jgi:hypothetical protein